MRPWLVIGEWKHHHLKRHEQLRAADGLLGLRRKQVLRVEGSMKKPIA